jgi:FixJ family two-component response regulator
MSDVARILIADDEETFLQSMGALLRREGYACDCVRDAREAAAALEKVAYDLLITDIYMPGNAELEFLHDLQSRCAMIPVIVVTGYPSVPTAVESLRLSVVDYLIKPVDFPAVLHCVSRAIDKGRVLRSLHKTQEQMREWVKTMEDLERSLNVSGTKGGETKLAWAIDNYLDQMVGHIAQIAASLKMTIDTLRKDYVGQTTDVCALIRCPRLEAYETALRGTIEVLRKTKNAFKSKELAALRERLEEFLKKDHR